MSWSYSKRSKVLVSRIVPIPQTRIHSSIPTCLFVAAMGRVISVVCNHSNGCRSNEVINVLRINASIDPNWLRI